MAEWQRRSVQVVLGLTIPLSINLLGMSPPLFGLAWLCSGILACYLALRPINFIKRGAAVALLIVFLASYCLTLQFTTVHVSERGARFQIGFGMADWTLLPEALAWKRQCSENCSARRLISDKGAFNDDKLSTLWKHRYAATVMLSGLWIGFGAMLGVLLGKPGMMPRRTDTILDELHVPDPRVNSMWYDCNRQSETVIVFIHGIFSDSRCWLNRDSTGKATEYWPHLILSDPRFHNPAVFLAGYFTDVDAGRSGFRDCADAVLGALRRPDSHGNPPVMNWRRIIFVCHSMGGIVTRYMLEANQASFADKEIGLVLIASPSMGSKLASQLKLIARVYQNRQGEQLQWGGELLEDLDDRFKNLLQKKQLNIQGIEFYEHRFISPGLLFFLGWKWIPLGIRWVVVTKASAGRYFGAPKLLPNTDHFSAVTPNTVEHVSHLYLFDFLRDSNFLNGPPQSVATDFLITSPVRAPTIEEPTKQVTLGPTATVSNPRNWKYRVIAFGLDGTLVRGPNYDYSWQLIWEKRGLPKALHRTYMRKFLERKWDYDTWCREVVDQFRRTGFRLDQMPEIVRDLTVTKTFEQTLCTLRNEGFVCALVSGGVDVLLYQMIPNAKELFDHIFINQLQFDAHGVVEGVIPTKYDFEGKAEAIRLICEKSGCRIEESVFVGEGFNDEHAVRSAGLSIAYPPKAERTKTFAHISITDDDLSKILEYVLAPA